MENAKDLEVQLLPCQPYLAFQACTARLWNPWLPTGSCLGRFRPNKFIRGIQESTDAMRRFADAVSANILCSGVPTIDDTNWTSGVERETIWVKI